MLSSVPMNAAWSACNSTTTRLLEDARRRLKARTLCIAAQSIALSECIVQNRKLFQPLIGLRVGVGVGLRLRLKLRLRLGLRLVRLGLGR